MLKRVAALLFVIALALSVSFAEDAAKEARVEGKVLRSNADKSTLTVMVRDTNSERTVYYDASTKWVSQYHGDKKVNNIDAGQVKDGDQVICLGTYKDKEFHATMISKRLSHSPE
jgi:uncharacterized protein YdaL